MTHTYRGLLLLGPALLIMALLAAGCSGPPTPPLPEPEAQDAAPAASTDIPTATLAPSPLPSLTPAPAATGTLPPTRDPSLPDVPYEMTGYEVIAAGVGTASYSGYACLITAAGCACELPLIQQVTFTFNPDGTLSYRFEGEGYASTWVLLRAGPNQWEYALSIRSDVRDEAVGEARALISFTDTGYVYSQFVNYFDTGLVVCPEVTFRRLPAGP